MLNTSEGILPINKEKGRNAFSLVASLRKLTGIRTIGHAGTLDPFAEGVMVLLIGKPYTRQSGTFLNQDKEYIATVHLGIVTDTYDCDGKVTAESPLQPTLAQIEEQLLPFQGTILQTPPMFSAKKVEGKKLYTLARQGITIERKAAPVTLRIEILSYNYPSLTLRVACSKGTYIRSLAYDLGQELGCGAHLSALTRTRSGPYTLEQCCEQTRLFDPDYDWRKYLTHETGNRSLSYSHP